MADNAFVKIGTALLKHQVKKLVGDETLEVIGEELADIGGDKLDAWLGDKSTLEEIEKAAQSAQTCFREKVMDDELQQWMISLPLGNLQKVVEAIDELPSSPDESKLESALRESIALNWKKLSSEQVDNTVNSFLSCLRSALLPIEKQTLMVIGRSVLRTEDKVDLLIRWFEQYIITGKPIEIKQLNPEPNKGWYLAHPYPMPPNFTGRVEERKMLTDWLNKDSENRLFILRALGGFGKSALSWHWLTHDVDSKEWEEVVFWSFYEGDASFEHFIEETLKYLKLEVPQGQRLQIDELLKAMQSQKILLIMDGFERALRAYSSMNAAYQGDSELPSPLGEGQGGGVENQLDCVNLNAEIFLKHLCSLPNIKSKVLMTTRLTPRAVKPRGEFMLGCREVELTSMQPADAVEFFHRQGIQGTRVQIETACTPYGYHPLSLRILAGLISNDRDKPSDIEATMKLDITENIVANKNHVLKVCCDTLSPEEQKLLSIIACFRYPTTYNTLLSITNVSSSPLRDGVREGVLRQNLNSLENRGVLFWDRINNKYDLHPIVRLYVRKHTSSKELVSIHQSLYKYFKDASNHQTVYKLEELTPSIEYYYHSVMSQNYENAFNLLHDYLGLKLFYQFGAYQTNINLVLLMLSKRKPNSWKNKSTGPWMISFLGSNLHLNGQSSIAIRAFQESVKLEINNDMRKNLESLVNFAASLFNISSAQIPLGHLKAGKSNLVEQLKLSDKMKIRHRQAYGYQKLGQLYAYLGKWEDAKTALTEAWKLCEKNDMHGKSVTAAYRSFLGILHTRQNLVKKQAHNKSCEFAYDHAQKSLDFAVKTLNSEDYAERNFVRAYWVLGSALRLRGNTDDSEHCLNEALTRARTINLVLEESDILLDLARLRYDQKNYDEAKSLADEALLITERCGYVLQGADVNLFLAQYALEQEKDKAKAKGYAEEAKRLATCDGPPYYYKVAYEEAERMLEKL